jgi:hypothetical protein
VFFVTFAIFVTFVCVTFVLPRNAVHRTHDQQGAMPERFTLLHRQGADGRSPYFFALSQGTADFAGDNDLLPE